MEVARRRIERAFVAGEQVVVTDLVMAEVFHALRHHYGVPAAVALGRLRDLLGSGVVRLDPAGAEEALGPRGRGQAGVVDRLIVARHRSLGATTPDTAGPGLVTTGGHRALLRRHVGLPVPPARRGGLGAPGS